MRDRIWTELTQAKFNVEFATLYVNRQRVVIRYFNIAILIFSTGGIMGWKFWDKLPIIACVIIALVSLLRLVQPHIIMTEKQISNLDTINKFYFDYYNRLEQLWYDFNDETMTVEKSKVVFFEIKQSENQINTTVNETIRSKPKKLSKEAKKNCDQYFKQTFNTSH